MKTAAKNVIIGQGLAGSAMAWTLHWSGQTVCLIDGGDPNSASRVAAGLITPVTGKRLVKSPEFNEQWWAAKDFYQRVEGETNCRFFHETTMVRVFPDEEARHSALNALSDTGVEEWHGALQKEVRQQTGLVMKPSARLDVIGYLEATRRYFERIEGFRSATVDLAEDLQIDDHEIRLLSQDLTTERLIICTGANQNELFPEVPNNPCRGDILNVQIQDYQATEIVHRSIWIVPVTPTHQIVGSTYDWQNVEGQPQEAGRKEILEKLERLVEGSIEVTGHRSGTRPTMKDYQPVAGKHRRYNNVYVFNGLGSKGALRAPKFAEDFVAHLDNKRVLDPAKRYDRLFCRDNSTGKNIPLTKLAQCAVEEVLKSGDNAIDATVGNGFDTVFLASIVGINGVVTGIDVQQAALDATKRRLEANDLCNVNLVKTSHEEICKLVTPQTITAVMFNLGFLPRSDHSVITQPDSTTTAITSAISALKEGGILTVLCYRGHDGGPQEFEAVDRLLSEYADRYDLQQIDSTPKKVTSPVLFVLRKTTEN